MEPNDTAALTKQLHASIVAGVLDDAACAALETLAATNASHALRVISKLSSLTSEAPSAAAQLAVALKLLQRLAEALPQASFVEWQPVLFQALDATHVEVSHAVTALLPELMKRDEQLMQRIFELYMSTASSPSTCQREVLVSYGCKHAKSFFTKCTEYMTTPQQQQQQQLRALELLNDVVAAQGPLVYQITETNCFQALITILRTDTNVSTVGVALLILTMLLPVILPQLPNRLLELLRVLKRMVCWSVVYPANAAAAAATAAASSSATLVSASASSSATSSMEYSGKVVKTHSAPILEQQTDAAHREKNEVARIPSEGGVSSSSDTTLVVSTASTLATPVSSAHTSNSTSNPRLTTTSPSSGGGGGLAPNSMAYLQAMPPKQLQPIVTLYFHHLYGMFPVSCIHFLKEQSANDPTFSWLVKPLINGLRLTPLILSSSQEELELSRWKNKQPDEIVTDCIATLHLPPFCKAPMWYPPPFSLSNSELPATTKHSHSAAFDRGSGAHHHHHHALAHGGSGSGSSHLGTSPSASLSSLSAPQAIPSVHMAHEILFSPVSTSPGMTETLLEEINQDHHLNRLISNPLGDSLLSIEGMSILELHNYCEKQLVLGSRLYPWNKPNEGASSTTGQGESREALQEQLILCRNELLFERYLRQQYLCRFSHQHRARVITLAERGNVSNLEEEIKQRGKTIEGLEAACDAQASQIEALKRNAQTHYREFEQRIRTLESEKQELEAHITRLQLERDDAVDRYRELEGKLQEQSERAFVLSLEVRHLRAVAEETTMHRSQVAQLNLELTEFDDLIQESKTNQVLRHETEALLDARTAEAESLRTALLRAQRTNNDLLARLEDSNTRVTTLEAEKRELASSLSSSKHLIERAQSVAHCKIEAVDAKYKTQRAIILALEKRVMELQAEAEGAGQRSIGIPIPLHTGTQ